ncbi:ABC transporter permease [Nocardioides sp. SYSU D00038]|uniref:ABC transporter permease n=1 Tax=Nocardioides sp. SYSU D00038 TaxID=2812554 RepID=UPI0019682F5E|nr:ABC transporter permease [Nocardioides sp. SYSU D00038]
MSAAAGLAVRSLRHRATTFVATFVTVLLGTALIGSFATLAETATGPVPDVDAETLTVMGAVVGGWGSLIVLFAVASTTGIAVAQRDVEVGLLRVVGATPRQVRQLVRTETLVVSLVAALLGAALAAGTGRALLALLREGGLVSGSVAYGGGPASLGLTVAAVLTTCLVASTVTGRRATRGAPSVVPGEGRLEARRLPWWRVLAGLLLVGYGIAMGVVTIAVTRHSDDPYDAMATSGSSSILVGVGLATLSPVLLRWLSTPLRPLLDRLPGGATGHLAAFNTSRRAALLGGVLGPVIVLSAAAIGTLMVVGIDQRTVTGAPGADTDLINLLNNVVVGMLSLFAAILVVSSFAAVVSHRRAELRRLWLLGATPGQVTGSVLAEAAVVATVGVGLGAVASLASIVPFAVARDEGLVPDGQLWLPPLVVAGVVALTLLAARSAVHRAAPLAAVSR